MSAHDFMSFVRHYMFVSLVVGAVETGCKYAPDRRQRCQEAPKRCQAMPAWFSLFFYKKSMAEGALEPPLFVSRHPTAMGGREGWEPRVWLWCPCVFWHFLCLCLDGVGSTV